VATFTTSVNVGKAATVDVAVAGLDGEMPEIVKPAVSAGRALIQRFWRCTVAVLRSLVKVQLIAVGDTDKDGGWVNGLHGMFALVVLVLAAVIAHRGMRALGLGKSTATT